MQMAEELVALARTLDERVAEVDSLSAQLGEARSKVGPRSTESGRERDIQTETKTYIQTETETGRQTDRQRQ